MKQKVFIGVDFGGTKILTGAINEDGKLLCEPIKVPTVGSEEPNKIVKKITNSIEEVLRSINVKTFDVVGIGMGVTGPLDIKRGIILECPQLPTMHYFPLRKKIEEYFSLPVFMNNDANCLIFGEALFGAGVGLKNIVGFTLGTGIGCAIIMDKKIFNGTNDSAGEIWPSPYKNGTIEDLVCGAGIAKIYKNISGKENSSLEIFHLAEEGNLDALKTWDEFGEHLAVAISWAINLIDPELIILGGSIANAFKFFSNSMEKSLKKWICPEPAEKTKVVCANLGANAGFIGAAALVLMNIK